MTLATSGRLVQAVVVTAAVLLLNISVAFENVWPTLAVTWRGALSVEMAVLLLALALVSLRLGAGTRDWLRVLAALWVLLVLGRYADVTASALFGRDINLYWELRFMPDVASLFANVAHPGVVAAVVLGVLFAVAALWWIVRWAIGQVAAAMAEPRPRAGLVALAVALIAAFVLQPVVPDYEHGAYAFTPPVSGTYARQVRLAVSAFRGTAALPLSPPLHSDLSRVTGADVLLIFLESYGAVTYDNPWMAERLAASRAQFDAAIRDTKRDVVSALVESPTFGGSSWLAHISLLSGVDVHDPDTNALLMTEQRDTWPKAMSRGGYRTVGLMPGLWQQWPEGSFYGFDDIYGGERLHYTGPQFGWFDLPDQFALAKFDALEAARPARPTFTFFPTITAHAPFTPTPPYQPDWSRMLTDHPFDQAELDRAYAQSPDWTNLTPSYTDSMAYSYATVAGYLRAHPERDLVVVLLGDHQPPALVSGAGAPWDVPVHVIASRPALLERLRLDGFVPGLIPSRPHLGRMHALLPMLLAAFGD